MSSRTTTTVYMEAIETIDKVLAFWTSADVTKYAAEIVSPEVDRCTLDREKNFNLSYK